MDAAMAAKSTLICSRSKGEEEFDRLLTRYPADGMIYFQRGEAYERIGEMQLAALDYQRAIHLFREDTWQRRALEAFTRVTTRDRQ
jgi:tetratricopeptide (TPR) repeat protein